MIPNNILDYLNCLDKQDPFKLLPTSKRALWIKARSDYEPLFSILDGMGQDAARRFWIERLEAQENKCDIGVDTGHMSTGVEILLTMSGTSKQKRRKGSRPDLPPAVTSSALGANTSSSKRRINPPTSGGMTAGTRLPSSPRIGRSACPARPMKGTIPMVFCPKRRSSPTSIAMSRSFNYPFNSAQP
jgi:hypothetical protein